MPPRRDARLVVPRLSFPAWLDWFRWEQGEHVSLIGPTGQGKTVLTRQIIPRRDFVVILAVKPRDDSMWEIINRDGYERLTEWRSGFWRRPPRPRYNPDTGRDELRVVLWPDYQHKDDAERQAEVFTDFFADALAHGGYTIVADDVAWLCEMLHLDVWLKSVWKLGRSSGLSLLANIQRPRFVPLDAYSMATHVAMWGTNDEEDLRRVAGLGGLPSEPLRDIVRALPAHDFLSVNTRAKVAAVSRVR